jgi:hypothetical protein
VADLTTAFCNRCARETNHEVLHLYQDKFRDKDLEEDLRAPGKVVDSTGATIAQLAGDPNAEAWYTTSTELLKCRGCDGVTIRQQTCMGEEMRSEEELRQDFGDDWTDFLEIVYYPPVSARRKPEWMHYRRNLPIPDPVKALMGEIYTALQNGSRRLVAMGTRAVLETIMVNQTGDHRSFARNLDEFQKAGYLSLRQRNTVEAILEAGHATIHRGWEPTAFDIDALMNITESVIETTYLHESQAQRLETSVPRRLPPRGSRGSARPTGPAGADE